MEKTSIRLIHINTTTSTTTFLPLLTNTFSLQFHSSSSSLFFPSLSTHTKCLLDSWGSRSFSYPMRRSISTIRAIPDGDIPVSRTEGAAMDSHLALKECKLKLLSRMKGMKSSLKGSLGKMLADLLRYYYFDSDGLVEEAVGGASAAKSYREGSEKDFCASETEVLKQLSSMGRLVVCAGNGAVQSSTNLALLRHGITLWIDVPVDIVARDVIEDRSQLPLFEISTSGSYTEVTNQLAALYNKYRDGYATADAIISLQKIASRLGCDNFDDITAEDMTLEALREIEKLTRAKKMLEEAARPF